MKKDFFRRTLAVGTSVVMLFGNAIPAMAASGDGTSGTGDGQGTSTGHLDTSYVEASVPTDASIADLFSFYVDSEDIIGQGGKFATADVTKVNDLVYFPTETAGTYASTSQDLEITIKNYQKVDVTVTATVDADTTGLIELVDSDDDISTSEAADEAALYLTLTVGTNDAVAITSSGATSTFEQAAQNTNFEVTGNVEEGYEVEPKSSVTDWAKVAISLSGKAQLVNDATGIVAPKVTLAYTIALHDDTPAIVLSGDYSRANNAIKFQLKNLTADVKSVKAYNGTTAISGVTAAMWSVNEDKTELTIDGTKFVFGAGAVGQERIIGFVLDDEDNTEIKVTVQVKQ